MTTAEWIGFGATLLLMLVGAAGCLVPAMPGTTLILAAAVGHRLYFGVSGGVSTGLLIGLAGLTLFSLALDYVAGMLGAKGLGASRWGIFGAAVGGIVGLFFGLVGILVGPFAGALALEFLSGRRLHEAGKAGVGATLGVIAGALGKLACALVMIGLFVCSVLGAAFG